LSEFTFRELQKCAERETALRLRVYAKQPWTENRERETRMMTAIAAHFKRLADDELVKMGSVIIGPGGNDAEDTGGRGQGDQKVEPRREPVGGGNGDTPKGG
jgi:hypothetical protein